MRVRTGCFVLITSVALAGAACSNAPLSQQGGRRRPSELWDRLLGGQRLIMGDCVTGPGAQRGAGGAGGC
jgi:hypothetical protein